MPELAEVEYYRRRWSPGLGRRVTEVHLHARTRVFRGTDVDALAARLPRSSLQESWAHGKQMLFRFSRGGWLGVHLGMTGELRTEAASYSPGRHDHLVLRQDKISLVFCDPRQFGRVSFDLGSMPPEWWTSRPPAVTSPAFTADTVAKILERRAGAPIKAVLLMQEFFPGIGNWMADEILWRARLHPATRAGRAQQFAGPLWTEARWVARAALRTIAKDFADPPASWLFRHRWRPEGRCPRDGAVLRRAEVGGRTTAWCPQCQARR
jgi:formamidopyrimidine-DNA glycosylase